MLKKIHRLTKDRDFDNIFNPPAGRGQSGFNKIIGIKAVRNQSDKSRFGIIVSAKISKKAVERNKIKRQIREIIRLQQDKIKSGYDVAVITLPDILGKKYQEIEESINRHFKRMGLYK